MAKSRKKKNEHKDFQKVKLKVGKKLPKGQNETIATFATRNIQIKDQLKSSLDEQPTTKRKLNIHDLLGQCNHYNVSVRHDAVMGIKELINTHPQSLLKYTGQILERCSELFMDKDKVVRSTVHKLLATVFPKISTNIISAFFPIISAHLCCAMTHLDDDIQLDSLIVVDLCLEHFPELLVNGSMSILNNFMDQISRQTQLTTKGSMHERTLIVNPSSKLSSQKWRNKVLERIEKFFVAYLKYNETHVSNRANNGVPSMEELIFSVDNQQVKNSMMLVKGNHASAVVSWKNESFNINRQKIQQKQEEFNLQSFIEVLLPLLLQCWMEAGPSQLATDLPGNVLSSEAITTLWNVLSILQHLLQIINSQSNSNTVTTLKWFSDKYLNDLVYQFMPYFPYAMHERIVKDGKHSKTKSGKESMKGVTAAPVSVRSLNLSVCKVMSYYINGLNSSKSDSWQQKIFDYLTSTLPQSKLNGDQVCLMVDILDNVINNIESDDQVNVLLELSYSLFKNCQQSLSAEMSALLKFFYEFAFKRQAIKSNRYPVLTVWMVYLPLMIPKLLKRENEQLLGQLLYNLKCAATFGCKEFLQNMKNVIIGAISDKNNGSEALRQLPIHIQCQLVELLFWVRFLTQQELKDLMLFINDSQVDKVITYHLLEVCDLRVRFQMQTTAYGVLSNTDVKGLQDVEITNHLSFLFSLLIGNESGSDVQGSQGYSLWKTKCFLSEKHSHIQQCQHRLFIIESCSNLLTNLFSISGLSEIVKTYLKKHMILCSTHETVSIFSLIGIMNIFMSLSNHTLKVEKSTTSDLENDTARILCDMVGSALALIHSFQNWTDSGALKENMDKSQYISQSLNPKRMLPTVELAEPKDVDKLVLNVLWDKCVASFINVPGLCDVYIKEFCGRISDSDLRKLQMDCSVLSKILCLKDIGKAMSHNTLSLLKETATHMKYQHIDVHWWVHLKYEVFLLNSG